MEAIERNSAMAIPRSAVSDRFQVPVTSTILLHAIAATAIDSRAFRGIVYK